MGYRSFTDNSADMTITEGKPVAFTFHAGTCLDRFGRGSSGMKFGVDIKATSASNDQASQVGKFHLFELPILGYAGYLPFGLLCGEVIMLIKSGTNETAH